MLSFRRTATRLVTHRPASPLTGKAARTVAIGSFLLLAPAALLLFDYPLTLARVGIAAVFAAAFGAWDIAGAVQEVLPHLPVDPVYASIAVEVITGLDLRGFAVAGASGEWLHNWLPGWFASPAAGNGRDWLVGVVAPGGSITARFLVLLYAEMLLLAVGVLLTWRATRAHQPGRLAWRLWLGIVLQGAALGSIAAFALVPPDYERMGLAPVINKLFDAHSLAAYQQIAAVFVPIVRLLVPTLAVLAVYGGCLLLINLRHLPAFWRARRRTLDLRLMPSTVLVGVLAILAVVQTGFVASGVVARGAFVSAPQPAIVMAAPAAGLAAMVPAGDAVAAPAPMAAATATPGPRTSPDEAEFLPVAAASTELQKRRRGARVGPTEVQIEGSGFQYQLLVNGQPRLVKGVGYNAAYASLSENQRRQLYARDFAQIRLAGIEVIQGWDPIEYDGVLLEVAQQHSLGVVMPIDLPVSGDYANPEYRAELKAKIEERVNLFKGQPAVWMWGLGNEVLHGIRSGPRARAFAAAYPELADLVRALDPKHPVFYRDAEDVFVAPLRDAMQAGGVARPWFVYGINIFTDRIAPVVKNWQRQRWDVPVILSEFGPMAYPAEDRPDGYRWMWGVIRSRPNYVLGGFVYVWFVDGPDPLDPMFGLVDSDSQAVDGTLDAVKQLFESPEAQ